MPTESISYRGQYFGVNVPTKATLDRYGLKLHEWKAMVRRFQGACWVCRKVPATGRMTVDHQHVAGWKKMGPEERRRYVRGVACTSCNHWVLTRYGTPEKFRGAADYLEDYAAGLTTAIISKAKAVPKFSRNYPQKRGV